jgi:hypothetical protein
MTYSEQWKAISSRIRGLMQAGQMHAQYLATKGSDFFSSYRDLQEQCKNILSAIQSFQEQFHQLLSPLAIDAINQFVSNNNNLITSGVGTPINKQQERLWATLVKLATFETEISFILSDVQESIRVRSERAFSHLQRTIIVDEEFRNKWQEAFDKREEECEKLGAIHLLWHGIWAFKVNAIGGRTDLVFQEPRDDITDIQRYADGIVLTEWKRAKPDDMVENKFKEARDQAQRYTQGVLAGSELAGYRYTVVVSRKQVKIPGDIRKGEVIYRHINIAVEPSTPSKV